MVVVVGLVHFVWLSFNLDLNAFPFHPGLTPPIEVVAIFSLHSLGANFTNVKLYIRTTLSLDILIFFLSTFLTCHPYRNYRTQNYNELISFKNKTRGGAEIIYFQV